MILTSTLEKIETNATNKPTALTIKDTSKIFRLLSQKLYSDKKGSIIRELVANAKDSHIEAGNSEPFEIHLPTKLSPEFKIKDYGTGMSEKDIDEIYRCVGETTKDESNDFLGMYGIGSKSPLAYTSSFMITSIHNNKKMTFAIHIDENDDYSLTELLNVETVEPNGFEVFFGVDDNDFDSFRRKTYDQLYYLDFPYKLNGEVKEPFTSKKLNSEIVYEDDDCFLIEGSYHKTINVMFGGLNYEISNNDREPFEIEGYNVYYKCNIGEIDVSASKEDISLTKSTREILLAKQKRIYKKLIDFAIEKFDVTTAESMFDLRYKFFNSTFKWARTWIFGEYVTERFTLDTRKYDKLRFYQDGKILKGENRFYYHTSPKFVINNINSKISVRNITDDSPYMAIVVLPKYGAKKQEMDEVQIQINQFIMDFDSKERLKFLDEETADELSTPTRSKDNNLITYSYIKKKKYSSIYNIVEADDDFTDQLWFIKFKNDIIDPDTGKILFHYSELKTLYLLLPQDMRNNCICFTKAEFRKFKKHDMFSDMVSGKKFIVDMCKEYIDNQVKYHVNEGKYGSTPKTNSLLWMKKDGCLEFIDDPDLIDHINNYEDKKYLDDEIRKFLRRKNWTGHSFNLELLSDLNKRYSYLDNISFSKWDTDDEKLLLTDIINLLYNKSNKPKIEEN